jgi:hypothetical protein
MTNPTQRAVNPKQYPRDEWRCVKITTPSRKGLNGKKGQSHGGSQGQKHKHASAIDRAFKAGQVCESHRVFPYS